MFYELPYDKNTTIRCLGTTTEEGELFEALSNFSHCMGNGDWLEHVKNTFD